MAHPKMNARTSASCGRRSDSQLKIGGAVQRTVKERKSAEASVAIAPEARFDLQLAYFAASETFQIDMMIAGISPRTAKRIESIRTSLATKREWRKKVQRRAGAKMPPVVRGHVDVSCPLTLAPMASYQPGMVMATTKEKFLQARVWPYSSSILLTRMRDVSAATDVNRQDGKDSSANG